MIQFDPNRPKATDPAVFKRLDLDLAEVRDFADLVQLVSKESITAGADGISLILREGELCHYVEERAIAPLWRGQRFPMISCVSGWAMMLREAVSIADIYADVRVPHDAYRPTFVKSLLLVPIDSTTPIGALGVYWGKRHVPSPEEIQAFQALANRLAPTVQRLL